MATRNRKALARSNGTRVGGWANTNDALTDVCLTLQKIEDGTLDLEKGKIMSSLFRTGATLIGINLDHAKTTKRLVNRQVSLTGIQLKK